MIRYKHYALLITIIALSGCHLLAVGISGMPGWSCIRAKEPITLFRDLDMTVGFGWLLVRFYIFSWQNCTVFLSSG